MVESFELGDVIQTRKPHACGNDKWTVIRVGADVKIKCTACGADRDDGAAAVC